MTRVISGVALAAAALAAILFLPLIGLRALACVVAAVAAHEYVRVAGAARGISQWVLIAAVAATCWFASVGLPIDLLNYEADSLRVTRRKRLDQGDPYFTELRTAWSEGVRTAFRQLPEPSW